MAQEFDTLEEVIACLVNGERVNQDQHVQSELPRGEILPPNAKTFHSSADVTPATAKMRFVTIAEEIIAALSGDPSATVKVTVEITADFPDGVSDQTKCIVSENASLLGLKT